MQFASKKIRNKVASCTSKTQGKQIQTPYLYFHNKNKQKYRECLSLIEAWSQDLIQRENNVHKLQQKYIQNYQECENQHELPISNHSNKQNKCSSINTNPNANNSSGLYMEAFDLQEMLSREFVKKMESLYMKQFMLRDFQGDSRQPLESCQQSDSLN